MLFLCCIVWWFTRLFRSVCVDLVLFILALRLQVWVGDWFLDLEFAVCFGWFWVLVVDYVTDVAFVFGLRFSF